MLSANLQEQSRLQDSSGTIARTILTRSYTLDKLVGPLSIQFLLRVPEAKPAALNAESNLCLHKKQ